MSDKKQLSINEIRGLISSLVDATVGVTDIAQNLNKAIINPPILKNTPLQKILTKIYGLSYETVKLSTNSIGFGLDKILSLFNQELSLQLPFEQKEFAFAILNGVVGDYLEKTKNALAFPMQFRADGLALDLDKNELRNRFPDCNGKLLIMVHGLCGDDVSMNLQNHDHGKILAEKFGYTPIYLRYNSGLHISINGQLFAHLLEELHEHYHTPINEISILCHSMGGLVSRSAFHYGTDSKWITKVHKIFFLGTPHNGAPLEKIGFQVHNLFDKLPYVKPFSGLAKLRSAGITDLRFGSILDADWQNKDRFKENLPSTFVQLPQNIDGYAVAGCINKEHNTTFLGDGMVTLNSAFGKANKSDATLSFQSNQMFTAYETSHMGLLSSQKVFDQLNNWME